MQQLLNNPQQPPTDELLQLVLRDHYACFEALQEIFARHGIEAKWNYYKDGKSWLCKTQYRGKTVLWLSVWEDCFKLSFHFTEKTRPGVEKLEIAPALKSMFREQKATGKLIPLILEVRNPAILNDAEKLIIYKIS